MLQAMLGTMLTVNSDFASSSLEVSSGFLADSNIAYFLFLGVVIVFVLIFLYWLIRFFLK